MQPAKRNPFKRIKDEKMYRKEFYVGIQKL